MATISELKQEIGLAHLDFQMAVDANDVESDEWCRHWDNDKRISVSMHLDTINQLKANPGLSSLFIQEKILGKIAKESGDPYDFYRICNARKVIASF